MAGGLAAIAMQAHVLVTPWKRMKCGGEQSDLANIKVPYPLSRIQLISMLPVDPGTRLDFGKW